MSLCVAIELFTTNIDIGVSDMGVDLGDESGNIIQKRFETNAVFDPIECVSPTQAEGATRVITNPFLSNLCDFKSKNKLRISIAHLNINSIRNKFDDLRNLVVGNIDILLISETKIDASFPKKQFIIDGYTLPYRLDKSEKSGGLLLYVREDIASRAVKTNFTKEGIFLELNFKKRKWLMFGGYNPNKCFINEYLKELGQQMDNLIRSYDNLLIIGDLNSELSEIGMQDFCSMYNLQNLIKVPTCYKNPLNPSCIDLMLTNRPGFFQHSQVFETGLSDFHKLTVTVMKMSYLKLKPKIISYRDYKHFNNEHFRRDFLNALECNQGLNSSYEIFEGIFMTILNDHAPKKLKYLRGNQQPFMNKDLSKAIMHRSRLRNKYLKERSVINRSMYVTQRNYCVNLLRKVKRKYYSSIDISNIHDNKKFWKMVKPFFTDKINTNEQITLLENNVLITDSANVAQIMVDYFSNVVESLEIPENIDLLNMTDSIEDPIEKAILKYKRHPSIIKIDNKGIRGNFSITHTTVQNVTDIIMNIDINKATSKESLPAKILKTNVDLFSPILCNYFNSGVTNSSFPNLLKLAEIKPTYKKDERTCKENYRPVSLLPAISKVYEKVLYGQLNIYFDKILSHL